ncbi:MAG: HAMP domain-containing protein [Hyphomicrobiales bacterium]|nr:HAMP domain-containing protein [Hyphomicrobiales bacterium]
MEDQSKAGNSSAKLNPDSGSAKNSKKSPTASRSKQNRPGLLARIKRIITLNLFSSLSRRIATLNLIALVVLLSGILYLNQFREGLIDARVESLMIQGRIIAGAIAASATVETNTITIDPEKLIELQAGESTTSNPIPGTGLESPLSPERVAPLLRSLIRPTQTRARIYDSEGSLLLDSRHLYAGGRILRYELPALNRKNPGMTERIGKTLNRWLQRNDLPIYRELAGKSEQYPEVKEALIGGPATVVRMTERGALIVSVAVPIQRFRAVHGVLLLSTQGNDIDRIVTDERIAIMRVFLVASIVTLILSILLASTIANPLRKLSEAAIRVRYGTKSRIEIPDFSARQDEVGNLSSALRSMTNSLYARIEAIEQFAADVSHELKNPLTSLRSAVETLPLARNASSKKRLMDVIKHDVIRLDRLITDISNASRLDADLVRDDTKILNMEQLLQDIVSANREIKQKNHQLTIDLEVAKQKNSKQKYLISGHQARLGQVFTNLIDNARSFVPASCGQIDIKLSRTNSDIEVIVEDNGPGIEAENIFRIFERFYTDRAGSDDFGQNSGLGLSISKQIIEAHGGTIVVENIPDSGARFIVCLPAED